MGAPEPALWCYPTQSVAELSWDPRTSVFACHGHGFYEEEESSKLIAEHSSSCFLLQSFDQVLLPRCWTSPVIVSVDKFVQLYSWQGCSTSWLFISKLMWSLSCETTVKDWGNLSTPAVASKWFICVLGSSNYIQFKIEIIIITQKGTFLLCW